MNFKKLFYTRTLSLILIWLLTSCERYIFLKDNVIPSDLKQRIHALNDSVINSIIQKDTLIFSSIASDALKAVNHIDHSLLQKFQFSITNPQKVINDYYFYCNKNMVIKLADDNDEGEGYVYHLKTIHKEGFVSIVTLENGNLLILIYGKEKSKWKLDAVNLKPFIIEGKWIYEWYKLLKNDYKNGNLLLCVRDISVIGDILKNSGELMYLKYNEIQECIKKITHEFSERIREKMDSLPNKPVLFSVYWFEKDHVRFPEVWYKTNLSLSDSIAIQQECTQVHQKYWELYTGKNRISRKTYYRICQSSDQKICDLKIVKE